ncbi:hypothetical protein ACLFMI_02395 [Pseudonocardia nantongensis]|uniref:hypothetical protein n=1 Tax=Pseudonocardia nantongensis TaxID=1181885 RepID=UPI00397B2C99
MTSFKAEGQLAEFLRRVLAGDDDVAPVTVIFGAGAVTPEQQSLADQFASSLREQGYIEPATGGPGDDLARVRVSRQGHDWLAEYEQRSGPAGPGPGDRDGAGSPRPDGGVGLA